MNTDGGYSYYSSDLGGRNLKPNNMHAKQQGLPSAGGIFVGDVRYFQIGISSHRGFFKKNRWRTPLKTTTEPKNGGLEDVFPFQQCEHVRVNMLVFAEV